MEAPSLWDNIVIWLGSVWASIRHNWKPKLKRLRLHFVSFALFLLGIVQLVDPYLIASMLPERWAAVVPFAFGGLVWLLRKATSGPVVVTTTFHGEAHVTTELDPHYDGSTTEGQRYGVRGVVERVRSRDAADFGHDGPDDKVL